MATTDDPTNEPSFRASPGIDPQLLNRIRALLAKAEGTSYEEEANAFTAKAYELMARYSIEQAMLGGEDSEPVIHKLVIDAPYASAKFNLLSGVSYSSRCRAVWSGSTREATVVGYPRDVSAVELLFTSLLLQAATAMLAEGPVRDRDGRVRTKSFRQAFLLGFSDRITDRLVASQKQSTEAARLDHGESVLPVLASVDHKVEDKLRDEFPNLRTMRSSISSGAGLTAGRQAGATAQLDSTSFTGSKRALGA
ncbi:MAG: hypothetical protein ACI91O_000980 [Candidatus Poriferisodalaceae bacterium]|jgi:hypothetical protein